MVMSIESYQDKFLKDVRPYWKLYGKGNTLIAKNTDIENITESWEMLENQMNRFPFGNVKIITFSDPSARQDTGWETAVSWGNQVGSTGGQVHSQQNQGFGGNMMQMLQMMQFFQNQSDARLKESLANSEARFKESMLMMEKMFKLQRDNEKLKEELDTDDTPVKEQLLAEIIGCVKPIGEAVAEKIKTGGFKIPGLSQPQPQAQLGTIGQAKPKKQAEKTSEATPEPTMEAPKEAIQTTSKRVSLDRMTMAAQRIQRVLPSEHINEVLDLLAAFVEANPDQVMELLNQLKAGQNGQ
jgi:hypothetical protein